MKGKRQKGIIKGEGQENYCNTWRKKVKGKRIIVILEENKRIVCDTWRKTGQGLKAHAKGVW